MRNRFFGTAFTPAVLAEQEKHGSRAAYARLTDRLAEPVVGGALTSDERAFIETRDHFFLATVSETGWPHVQHRGGPAGFVHGLDEHRIAWADFIGNRQYVSIGNSRGENRVALIFIDYAVQRRLKVLGYMRTFEAGERPDLVRQLAVPGYPGKIEHLIQIEVEAFDWNCPQHITPRFTIDEFAARTNCRG